MHLASNTILLALNVRKYQNILHPIDDPPLFLLGRGGLDLLALSLQL
jgi:hypothetical protein